MNCSRMSFESRQESSLLAGPNRFRSRLRAGMLVLGLVTALAVQPLATAQLTSPATIDGVNNSKLTFNKTGAPAASYSIGYNGSFLTLDGNFPGAIQVSRFAPTGSITLDLLGNLGVGTVVPADIGAFTSPGKFLNVRADGLGVDGIARLVSQGNSAAQLNLSHIAGPANQKVFRVQNANGLTTFNIVKDDLASNLVTGAITIKNLNGNIGLRQLNPTHPLHLASGAHCTAGGVFTNASSRELKEKIRPLTSEQAHEAVRSMQPVEYNYKSEPEENYIGFIAEDVPELVATKDRKSLAPMDIVGVLTKVVQDQDRELAEHRRLIAEQREINEKLLLRLDALEKK